MNDYENIVAATEALLRRICAENGYRVNAFGEVSERTAALLLRYAGPSALRAQYHEGRAVVPCRCIGGRRFYSLRALAEYLERDPDDP
ncbi:hypothetical protein C7401_1379 [Paraburkholderia unamae]|uniref:hypothetical protein n=1 Tax=Paraburkholderia unamae TaxID=219649 RepID=UPI000DC5900A|nr:hypothetical protein [Paraburkholderia unamae]RAR51469.1 hypothetical protein C7401_1379 [Paraburkholderia unamae]